MHSGPLTIEVVDGTRVGEIVLRLAGPLVLDNLLTFRNFGGRRRRLTSSSISLAFLTWTRPALDPW